jgi:hypothetical protein
MSARESNPWGSPPPNPEPEGPFGGPWTASASDQGFGPEGEPAAGHQCVELCPICRGAELLRGAGITGGPGELRGQLDDVSREALLTLRALIDHYIERLDARPERSRVEEIPID